MLTPSAVGAYFDSFSSSCSRTWRKRVVVADRDVRRRPAAPSGSGAGAAASRSVSTVSSTAATASNGARDRPGQPLAADGHQDRVHEAVEPRELVLGRGPPRLGRWRAVGRAPTPGRRVGQQVDVDADDRQRRPQLVGHDATAARRGPRRARSAASSRASTSAGQPALLDDPGEQRRDRAEEPDLLGVEDARRRASGR